MAAKTTNKKHRSQPPLRKAGLRPHVVHHRHSFKLIHHHHTSYSLLAFLVMLTALFSVGWTGFAKGDVTHSDSYSVHAVIDADPLTEAATFRRPTDNQRFSDADILASGTCPDDSHVTVERNGVFAGAAICDNNAWMLGLTLTSGKNVLKVQAYNRTNVAGPTTPELTVYYDPPVTPGQSGTSVSGGTTNTTNTPSRAASGKPTQTTANVLPLVLTSDFSYSGAVIGSELQQLFSISGGTTPYVIRVDWGDGRKDEIQQTDAGNFTLSHTYYDPGIGVQNSYIIKLEANDANGQQTSLQTMAIISNPNAVAAGGTSTDAGSGIGAGIGNLFEQAATPMEQFWKVAAPVYGATTVALASFWLGQHRAAEMAAKEVLHHRHPRHYRHK